MEGYIKDNDLIKFFGDLRNKYSGWITKSTTAVLGAKSVEGTITGAISEVLSLIIQGVSLHA